MSYLDDSPCFVRRLGSLVWGPKAMHWPTHVNVLPILTYPLCRIGFWFSFDRITVKGFCFGFDLTDLFDASFVIFHYMFLGLFGYLVFINSYFGFEV